MPIRSQCDAILAALKRREKVTPGFRVGRLIALECRGGKRCSWLCRCDCGTEKLVRADHLQSGRTKSCGCFSREAAAQRGRTQFKTHGGTKTPTYRSWRQMIRRCYDAKHPPYRDYGARGIGVCSSWRDFAAFLRDMGPRPEGHTLGRKNVNGHYEPGNCGWETPREQANNRRSNRIIVWQGKSQNVAQWAAEFGFSRHVLKDRLLRYGWPLERAMTEPLDATKPKALAKRRARAGQTTAHVGA